MGAYVISIAEKGSGGQYGPARAFTSGSACLRSAFRVKLYIVDEFMRGDIPCLFTCMNAVNAAIDSR